ncbi:hypothetical protein BN946_scf184983.g37 [Trametes cinnabarina]|uniref:Uncharacterized protein n=1 Tax=Pycnoporus cinnabarinus TaxID=5643 RepID=A0A060SJZ3_PYCCI|nr:hypothetical protein BN946_scf184983.g37 [Trametes cinnabarina]
MLLRKRQRADTGESQVLSEDNHPVDDEPDEWGGIDSAVGVPHGNSRHASSQEAIGNGLQPPASPPRRYATRASNRARHPGLDVGLNWAADKQQREEIRVQHAQRKAEASQKQQAKLDATAREEAGLRKLAGLENARAQQDQRETQYAERRAAQGFQDAEEVVQDARDSEPSGSEYNDDGFTCGDDDDDDIQDDVVEESEAPRVLPAKKKPITQAERRRQRQATVLGRISAARAEQGGAAVNAQSSNTPVRRTIKLSRPASELPQETETDAFRPGYRAKLLAGISASIAASSESPQRAASTPASATLKLRSSLSSHTSGGPLTPARANALSSASTSLRTPTPSRSVSEGTSVLSQRVSLSNTSRASTPFLSDDDAVGGFDDRDVAVNREAVKDRSKGDRSDLIDVFAVEEEVTAKLAAKRPRTRPQDMDVKRSLAANVALPQWLNTLFEDTIMPTILDHFGGRADPWTEQHPDGSTINAEEGNPSVSDIIQQLVTTLCPRRDYPITPTSRIVQIAKQRLTNWRIGFVTRAQSVVGKAHAAYRLQHPRATPADIAEWASAALDFKRGEAWWEIPAGPQERRGKGALQSHYLLKLLAPHLKIIQRSALEESPLPAGAMCLSCAALEIAFQAYQTGAYKKPTEKFNEENGGERCDGFYADIVQPQLLEHPEQFTALLEKANRHSTGASTSTRRVSKRSRRMMDSSPVREE